MLSFNMWPNLDRISYQVTQHDLNLTNVYLIFYSSFHEYMQRVSNHIILYVHIIFDL